MRKRNVAFVALIAALVLGVATMAIGVPMPVLSAGKTALVYPHSTYLVSTVTTPSVVMRRLAGSDEWTAFDAVSSTEPTTPLIRPKSTAGYKVVSDGIESDTVTVTVAAQLSKPQVNKHGHKWHKLMIKGWVSPKHSADATVGLTFYRWEKVAAPTIASKGKSKGKGAGHWQWVQHGDPVSVLLAGVKNKNQSKWSYKWVPAMKGTWKVVVSHEDVAHAFSSASKRTVIKR